MKIDKEQFDEMIERAKQLKSERQYLRVGQVFYTSLHDKYKQIATEIIGTDCDMFTVDSNIENFKKKYVGEYIN